MLPDRLELLRTQTALTGIDFLYVHDNQIEIDVYFHVEPAAVDASLVGDIDTGQLTIRSAFAPERSTIPVDSVSWPTVGGRRVLRLQVPEPGDFVTYRLLIDDARLDDHYNDVPFSFQAGCPSRLDCRPRDPVCVADTTSGPPPDYTARDFWGLRRAMLDAATWLEPTWADRNVADAAVMLTEVLASIGDEFSYTQDRVRWESSFRHATQRRSLRRHAHLVDHRIHSGTGASTWLAVEAGGPVGIGTVGAGLAVWAEAEHGPRVDFSIGHGLRDELDGATFTVDQRRNRLLPHVFDDGSACLPAGATELAIVGHAGAAFPDLGDAPLLVALQERSEDASVELRTWFVPVTAGTDDLDPLVPDPATGTAPAPITRLVWDPADAPPFDFDLTATSMYGNIVPVTAGVTTTDSFTIGPAGGGLVEAVERVGPNGSVEYLHSLPDPDGLGLVWRPEDPMAITGGADVRHTRPELVVLEDRSPDPPVQWEWRPTLVGPASSTPDDQHITLDDGTWGTVAVFHRAGDTLTHADWLSDDGFTIRFGDGEFGMTPPAGRRFDVTFRRGNGRRGNVPTGAIRHHDGSEPLIVSVTNLVPVTDGTEPETAVDVRRVAPFEWQTIAHRAVRTEDYEEALTRLDWVQAAGASSNWTGSWHTIIATPDPRDAVALTPQWEADGNVQLDRFRQAGRDTWLGRPRYADIDIDLTVCVDEAHYRGDVIERALKALLGDRSQPDLPYFFDPDNFVFGTPLNRASLEAAVQRVAGVKAVDGVDIRRRGHHDWRPMPLVVPVEPTELIRVVNDPVHPERGTLRIVTRGGA